MIRIGMLGGRGYVGEELLALLDRIPEYKVVYVGSRSKAGRKVADECPNARLDLKFADLSPESIRACPADAWIIAQPNGQAAAFVDLLEDTDCKIIDISADYRFDNSWTYGLPERSEDEIRGADRVSNPGCYATATQLALLPVLEKIDGVPAAFGVSGFSGAGRTPGPRNDPRRLADNLIPYSLNGHTHEREITQHLGIRVQFMPHVASFFRGISMTIATSLRDAITVDELNAAYRDYYDDDPLVGVQDEIPEIREVSLTNRCLIGGLLVDQRDAHSIVVVSVIDNLRKGAASQAIQNLNLMFDIDSEQGLLE